MEARECGAVALGIILAHYGKYVPLPELRQACQTTRDGVKISGMVRAAKHYGLKARAFKINTFHTLRLPFVVFWRFNHFLVVEGFDEQNVYVNDPAAGYRTLSQADFADYYSGIALTFEPEATFIPDGKKSHGLEPLLRQLRVAPLSYAGLFIIAYLHIITPLLFALALAIALPQLIEHQPMSPLPMALLLLSIVVELALWRGQHLLIDRLVQQHGAENFFYHLLRLPLSFFAGRYDDELSARVIASYERTGQVVGVLHQVASLLQVLVYGVVLLALDIPMGMLALFLSGITIAVTWYSEILAERYHATTRQQRDKYDAMLMQARLEDLKIQGGEIDFFNRITHAHAIALNTAQYHPVVYTLTAVLPVISLALLLWVGLARLPAVALSATSTIIILFYYGTWLTALPLLRVTAWIRSLTLLSDKLDDVLAVAPQAMTTRRTENALVSLNNVSFGYDENPVVTQLSFALHAGQHVALVGRSGSGKSTVIKLVAGLYPPQTGIVAYSAGCRLALVDDVPLVLPGTIAENLRLFQPEADAQSLYTAAADACLLPLERDIATLSRGEQQQLAIARALVNQPTLLLLDEATGRLDTLIEQHILQNLRRRDCACLMVAHRPSSLVMFDIILTMEQGQISSASPQMLGVQDS